MSFLRARVIVPDLCGGMLCQSAQIKRYICRLIRRWSPSWKRLGQSWWYLDRYSCLLANLLTHSDKIGCPVAELFGFGTLLECTCDKLGHTVANLSGCWVQLTRESTILCTQNGYFPFSVRLPRKTSHDSIFGALGHTFADFASPRTILRAPWPS